jgi:hypothetical protein
MSWQIAFEIAGALGGIATLLALMLGPMFYLGAKIDSMRAEIKSDMDEFRKESKEFHGRLCTIEEKKKK